MTPVVNVTADEHPGYTSVTFLWLPYVAIAIGFITFLFVNFWCYHRKYRERYRRKNDVRETRERMRERRRVLNLMKLRYFVEVELASKDMVDSENASEFDPLQDKHITEETEHLWYLEVSRHHTLGHHVFEYTDC